MFSYPFHKLYLFIIKSKVSEDPTVTYNPYPLELLSKESNSLLSNNKDALDGIAIVEIKL